MYPFIKYRFFCLCPPCDSNTLCSISVYMHASHKDTIPFNERPTCRVEEAVEATGIGRSKLYVDMKAGKLEFVKYGRRRLVRVPSLLKLVGGA